MILTYGFYMHVPIHLHIHEQYTLSGKNIYMVVLWNIS